MSISPPGLTPQQVDELKYSRLIALDYMARTQGWTQLSGMPFWSSWLQEGETLYTLFEDTLYCFPLGLLLNANYGEIWILSGQTEDYPPFLMGIYDSVPGENRPGARLHSSGLTHYETDEGSYNLHKFRIDPLENLSVPNAWLVMGYHNNPVANFILYAHSIITISQEHQLIRTGQSFYYQSTAEWTAGEVPESLDDSVWARSPIALVPGLVLI